MSAWVKQNIVELTIVVVMVVGLLVTNQQLSLSQRENNESILREQQANHESIILALQSDADKIAALESKMSELDNHLTDLRKAFENFRTDGVSKDAEQDTRLRYLEGMVP